MTLNAFLFQALNGLSTASGLFFIAVGLSLIFGVSRIINIAHGSLYMLGTYIAYSFATHIGGALGFWGGIVATALVVGVIGALIEILLLRRIYRAPELFQLLATFALVLVINDATLWLWGPEDLLGPRAPGLRGAVEILGRQLPSYDLFLIFVGPLVLLILHFALARTRFGRLVRAATQDREMVGALGVNQSILFHQRVRARRTARWARRCAAGGARAGQPCDRPHRHWRRLRRCRGRRHGLDHRRLPRRGYHC
jgi:branched-subunit amino acid ABC-type transport system permease component